MAIKFEKIQPGMVGWGSATVSWNNNAPEKWHERQRRCGCCGLVEEISDAPWARWTFATALGEDTRLCPSCAKQTAEFIAHLKDKNNPAAASADSGAWYHEDWD